MILFATLNMLACIAWALAWRWRVKPLWIVAPEQRPERAPGNFKISVIIPARNEGRRLPALLSSLREIGGVAEIIVADDSSSDNTRECADLAARLDPRIRAFSAPAKPDGWVGKPWALHHAARLARGDCLVFMDADVTPGAGVLDIAASIMAGQQLDALSLIQVRALRSLRLDDNRSEEEIARIKRLLLITLNGVAAGLQNTG